MANAMSFSVDFEKMLGKMDFLNKEVMAGAERGMGRAMLQLRTDAIMQRPTAPIDEGFLRGSCSVFVQNKKIPTPPIHGERTDKQASESGIPVKGSEIIGVIGFNVPYAARWHEVPAKFKEPSAGNKYLESKMSGNRQIYYTIIANAIKEVKVK